MKKPSQNHPKAFDQFQQIAGSMEGCIARLMVLCALDFGTKNKNVDYGHVGSLQHSQLQIVGSMESAEMLTGAALAGTALTDDELKFVDDTVTYIERYSEDSACNVDGAQARFFIRSALIAAVISGRK